MKNSTQTIMFGAITRYFFKILIKIGILEPLVKNIKKLKIIIPRKKQRKFLYSFRIKLEMRNL